MSKKLRSYPIYLAPQIVGIRLGNGYADVHDERNNDSSIDHNSIDGKIQIYERQVREWFLNVASALNPGFVVIMICLAYIEGVQQYVDGRSSNGGSGAVFKLGLRRIFNLPRNLDDKINDFYKQVRCGLFHNGMSGSQLLISNEYEEVIDFSEPETIKINPSMFLNKITNDFNNYIAQLKDENNYEARQNFNRMFDVN